MVGHLLQPSATNRDRRIPAAKWVVNAVLGTGLLFSPVKLFNPTMKTHKTNELITTLNDRDVVVQYNCYPGSRGARDSLGGGAGPPLEPDDPPEIDIIAIIDTETDKDILDEVGTHDLLILEERCFEQLGEMEAEPPTDLV